jgi:CheY-specific phosphatase CheX
MEGVKGTMEDTVQFSKKLMVQTEHYIRQLGVPLVEKFTGAWDNEKSECYTAMMEIKGAMKGYFMLKVEESLAHSLVNLYMLDAVKVEEIHNFADQVLAEITNTIVGNALNDREEINIFIGIPSVFVSAKIRLKSPVEPKHILSVKTEAGIFQCMFIRSDELWLDF